MCFTSTLSVKSALKQLKMEDAVAPLGLVSNPLISLMLELFSSVPDESSKYPIFPSSLSHFHWTTVCSFTRVLQGRFKLWFWLKNIAVTQKMT